MTQQKTKQLPLLEFASDPKGSNGEEHRSAE